MTDWTKHVGKRVLVGKSYSRNHFNETIVVEVSPSGERVKFRWPSGSEQWFLIDDYELIEVLSKQPHD